MSGYTYDMDVYLGKDRKCVTRDMTAACATVKQLTENVEGHGDKLYMDNFSLPNLFDDLTTENQLLWDS
jgi:hypothetical protein